MPQRARARRSRPQHQQPALRPPPARRSPAAALGHAARHRPAAPRAPSRSARALAAPARARLEVQLRHVALQGAGVLARRVPAWWGWALLSRCCLCGQLQAGSQLGLRRQRASQRGVRRLVLSRAPKRSALAIMQGVRLHQPAPQRRVPAWGVCARQSKGEGANEYACAWRAGGRVRHETQGKGRPACCRALPHQWFLTAFSLRPAMDCAISAHRLPCTLCACAGAGRRCCWA